MGAVGQDVATARFDVHGGIHEDVAGAPEGPEAGHRGVEFGGVGRVPVEGRVRAQHKAVDGRVRGSGTHVERAELGRQREGARGEWILGAHVNPLRAELDVPVAREHR